MDSLFYYLFAFVAEEPAWCLRIFAIFLFDLALSYFVFLSAKRRKLDNPVYWGMVTLFTGVISLVIYLVLNFRKGDYEKPKKKNVIVLSSLIALVVLIVGASFPADIVYKAADYANSTDSVVFKEGFLKYVVYDNKGTPHDVIELYNEYCNKPPVYTREGKLIENSEECIIDSDGYAIYDYDERDYTPYYCTIDDYDYYVYFDRNHNIYYYGGSCSWDKDGKLIFKKENYKNIKFEMCELDDDYDSE